MWLGKCNLKCIVSAYKFLRKSFSEVNEVNEETMEAVKMELNQMFQLADGYETGSSNNTRNYCRQSFLQLVRESWGLFFNPILPSHTGNSLN